MDSDDSDETYPVLAGTIDRGGEFETTFLARIILELVLDDNVRNFTICSNHEDFLPFDDVILKIKTVDNHTEKYAIQLKHSDNDLSIANLTTKKGLKIQIYTDKLKNEDPKNLIDFTWIIFTNRRFEYNENETTFSLKNDNVDVQVMKCQTEPFFEKCFKNNASYKFESKVPDFQTYLNNFFLYTNQPHVDQIKGEILDQFLKSFQCDPNAFHEFFNFLSNWSNVGGRRMKLTKRWMKQMITTQILSPLVQPISSDRVEEKFKILQETVNKSDVTLFEENDHSNKINCLWSINEECGNIDEAVMKKTKSKHQLAKFNENADSIMLWLLNKCPLIIKYKNNIDKAINLVKGQGHKFIVLYDKLDLCDPEQFIGNVSETFRVFKTLADLDHQSESYRTIIQTFRCSIQGKPDITLENLIGHSEEIEDCISVNQLFSSLNNSFQIGLKENISDLYIGRSVSKYLMEHTFLDSLVAEHARIIISRVEEPRNYFRTFQKVDVKEVLTQTSELLGEANRRKIYVSKGDITREDFLKFCQRVGGHHNYHHFKMLGDKLEWIQSRGDIQNLKKYITEVYVFEEELYKYNDSNNFEIFCGDPGIGKTTLMKNFKNNTFLSFWTVLISPKDHSRHFRTKGDDVDAFKLFIVNKAKNNLNNVDKKLHEILLKLKRVNFIWDGLDEVSERNLEPVISLIDKLSKDGFKQCVTSRNNLKIKLENTFFVLSKNIKEFEEEDQKIYIRRRLKCTEEELENVFAKIKNNISLFKYNEILSIPLQIYMYTDLLIQNQEMYNLLLENLFSLSDLYEHFINAKFNVYFKEKEQCVNPTDAEIERNEIFIEERIENYELAALVTYFPDKSIGRMNNNDMVKKFLNKIGETKDSVGIITSVFDSVPNFLHNSFGEYFAARYLSREFQKIHDLSCFIFEETYKNIRFLLDSILAKNCQAHLATLHKNVHSLKKCNKDLLTGKDGGGRNPLHLACSWGNTYPVLNSENSHIYKKESIKKENPDQREILEHLLTYCNPEEKDEVYKFNSFSYADMALKFFALGFVHENRTVPLQDLKNYNAPNLLYYSAVFDFDKIFLEIKQAPPFVPIQDEPLLTVAARHGSLKCCKLLVNSGEDILANNTLRDATPLHEACKNGHVHIVEFFIEVGDIIAFVLENGRNLLKLACLNGHANVAKLLLSKGVDINAVDANNCSLLHLCAKSGSSIGAKLLIDLGADINIVDNNRQTPLHLACKYRHGDVAKLLIDKHPNIDVSDSNGQTALHLACEYELHHIAELLIHNGINVDTVDNNTQTALHLACKYRRNGYIAKLLIERKANMNIGGNKTPTALHLACKYRNEEIAKLLIEQNANINTIDENGQTPLHLACEYELDNIAKLLIDKGINVDIVDNKTQTALHLACKYRRNGYIAKLLIERKANMNIGGNKTPTALHLACKYRNEEIAKLLIEQNANINTIDENGQTPLHLACEYELDNIAKLLIDKGINVDIVDNKTQTALHLACMYLRDRYIAKLLIEHNANINIGGNKTPTALHLACEYRNEDTAKLLIEQNANINTIDENGQTPLHLACEYELDNIAKLLIHKGINVDIVDNNNQTALHLACKYSRDGYIAKLLIERKANMNIGGNKTPTALHLACKYRNEEIAKLLIEQNANINTIDENGQTPLHLACEYELDNIAKLLIDKGINVDIVDNKTQTALHLACRYKLDDIAKLLIERKANINIGGNNTSTALHLACKYQNKDIAKLLIEQNANIDTIDENGQTPLHLACKYKLDNIAELLILKGIKVDIVDKNTQTALHLACMYRCKNVAELLIEKGADFNIVDRNGQTALHLACKYNLADVANLLIAKGADVNKIDNNRKTPLHLAQKYGVINKLNVS